MGSMIDWDCRFVLMDLIVVAEERKKGREHGDEVSWDRGDVWDGL